MSKIDVSELQGPLAEFMQQISGENGRERFDEFKLWLKKVTACLLKLVTTVTVLAVERFVAADAFAEDNAAGF